MSKNAYATNMSYVTILDFRKKKCQQYLIYCHRRNGKMSGNLIIEYTVFIFNIPLKIKSKFQ